MSIILRRQDITWLLAVLDAYPALDDAKIRTLAEMFESGIRGYASYTDEALRDALIEALDDDEQERTGHWSARVRPSLDAPGCFLVSPEVELWRQRVLYGGPCEALVNPDDPPVAPPLPGATKRFEPGQRVRWTRRMDHGRWTACAGQTGTVYMVNDETVIVRIDDPGWFHQNVNGGLTSLTHAEAAQYLVAT